MDLSLFTLAAATRLDDERRRRAFDVPVQQAVALACADTFSAASSTVFGAYYGGASAKERSEHARQKSNSYHNRKRYTWENANIVGIRAGKWSNNTSKGVKGVAWCHATAAAPKWLQERCGTNPETPAPLGLYLRDYGSQSECLRLSSSRHRWRARAANRRRLASPSRACRSRGTASRLASSRTASSSSTSSRRTRKRSRSEHVAAALTQDAHHLHRLKIITHLHRLKIATATSSRRTACSPTPAGGTIKLCDE